MDTMIREAEIRGRSAPTSTGPAGDPREVLLDAVTSLHASPNYHPVYFVAWLAGIDVPETTSDQPVPFAVAVRRQLGHMQRGSETRTASQQLIGDLLVRWSIPAGSLAEALSVTRQTIYLWRAGEEPKPANAVRLLDLHRQVAIACGSMVGRDARKHLTQTSRRTGSTRLQQIAKQVNKDHPLRQPEFTALDHLSGTDVDLPVVARKPTIRIGKARPIKSVRPTR